MNDVSSSRRKLGIAAITTTALALPLTASISYAAAEEAPQDQDSVETIDPDEDTYVWVSDGEDGGDVDVDVQVDGEDGERRVIIRTARIGEGEDGERRVVRRVIRHDGEGHEHDMSEEEIEEMMAEIEEELSDLDVEVEEHIRVAMAHSREAAEHARNFVFVSEGDGHTVNLSCDGDNTVVERELDDGRRAIMICRSQVRAEAISGLEEAREEIRNNPDIPEEMRERLLRNLERSVERMRSREVSFMTAPKPPRAPAAPSAYRSTVRFDGAAFAPRAVPMVSPITGVSMAPDHDPDCEEEHTVPVARTSA